MRRHLQAELNIRILLCRPYRKGVKEYKALLIIVLIKGFCNLFLYNAKIFSNIVNLVFKKRLELPLKLQYIVVYMSKNHNM